MRAASFRILLFFLNGFGFVLIFIGRMGVRGEELYVEFFFWSLYVVY